AKHSSGSPRSGAAHLHRDRTLATAAAPQPAIFPPASHLDGLETDDGSARVWQPQARGRRATCRSREFTLSALAREKNGRLPDQRSGSPRREEVAPGPTRVRRKSERERAEYAREGEVLIDSETPEDTEDRAAQLRRGLGRQRLRIQSADNFVKLGASQSDRMFVVRCSPWPQPCFAVGEPRRLRKS